MGPGSILFDLTQLVLRAGYKTPTGIGRVELAYARHFLRARRDSTRFLIAMPGIRRILSADTVERYIDATEASWGLPSPQGEQNERRLTEFLEFPFPSSPNKRGPAPSNRLALAADLIAGAAYSVLSKAPLINRRSPAPLHYINVSGSRISPSWVYRWLERTPEAKGVFLLHDLIPLTHPEYVRPKAVERHRRYVQRVAGAASLIVANSHFTQTSLETFGRQNNIALPPIMTAPLAVEDTFTKIADQTVSNAGHPYFVFVSTIEPRKNHLMLLQVWQRLVEKFGAAAPKLVLVGRRGWENENILDVLERGATVRNHVLECNTLPDHTLISLLRGARAVLVPTHVEGFGLPVAEALALRVPVICSDIEPFHEIAGDIPDYVDALAGRGWIKLIADYAQPGSARRKAQLERIARYQPQLWESHFAAIENGLQTLSADGKFASRLRAKPSQADHPDDRADFQRPESRPVH